MSDKSFDVLFKILLIGDMGVGKSCLLLRYSEDVFNPAHVSTIGVDFKIRTLRKNEKTVKLQAGQERFRTITNSYYKGAHGIIMVYDITKKQTFQNLNQWYEDICNYADENVSVILVGNKIDLVDRRQISKEQGEALAGKLKVPFLETSAKDSINVEKAFLEMVDKIYTSHFENKLVEKKPDDVDVIHIDSPTQGKKCGACGGKKKGELTQ